MRLVFISDTHNQFGFHVPDGDALVHCGDFTFQGSAHEIIAFDKWLQKQQHRYKVVIAGNHELSFEHAPEAAQRLLKTPIYLEQASIVIEGVKFFGSPYTPWFYDWAFNLPRGQALAEKWEQIPDDVDVLATHGPPYGIFDLNTQGEHCGDEDLLQAVERKKPKIHAFGHIHGAADAAQLGETLFVNASICTERYDPWQKAVVVDLVDGHATLVEDAL